MKKYSKPSTFNRKGKAISFKSTDFYISIDGKDVKGSISRFSMEIGSLSTSLIGMGISTTYGETLKDIDIKILENAGTLIDSTLKGKSFEYSSWPSPVATQKLINYIFERIEEEGFKPVLKKKKWFSKRVFAKYQRLSYKQKTKFTFGFFIWLNIIGHINYFLKCIQWQTYSTIWN